MIQAPGFGGMPDSGHFSIAIVKAHGVLGQVDVAEDADEPGGAAAALPAEDGVEGLGHPSAGRTSIGRSQAADALPAHSRAASKSGALMTQKPPICSFDSA